MHGCRAPLAHSGPCESTRALKFDTVESANVPGRLPVGESTHRSRSMLKSKLGKGETGEVRLFHMGGMKKN